MNACIVVAAVVLASASCNTDEGIAVPGGPDAGGAVADLAAVFATVDLAQCVEPTACGDCLPGCGTFGLGPAHERPFPLGFDFPVDPRQAGSYRLGRDAKGYLGLDWRSPPPNAVWIANAADWNRGTVSRFDGFAMREVARYFSVTCGSLPTGSNKPCDGANGCCALDDPARYVARRNSRPEPGHQAVQLIDNVPARVGVVSNACCSGPPGFAVVENRAPGGQASVTAIAGDPRSCRDRNHDGKVQTSSDVNGDGLIETDCNGDGVPDDVKGVQAMPCRNGLAQEFYGLDDECVLFTTNVGARGQDGRAVALVSSEVRSQYDIWAGTAKDGRLFRVGATSGSIEDDVTLPGGCQPDGFALDSQGVAWLPSAGGPLCWVDLRPGKGATAGKARDPGSGPIFVRGSFLDPEQNLWLGDGATGEAWRYTPDRSKGLDNLGAGFWTRVRNPGKQNGASGPARAITVDWRIKKYFTWLATADSVVEIPASTIGPAKMDLAIDGTAFPVVHFPTLSLAALTNNGDLVAVSDAPSTVVRARVDLDGAITPPDLVSPPKGGSVCPAGDRCPLTNPGQGDPGSAAGDFSSFLCNFSCGADSWSYVVTGCTDAQGAAAATDWLALSVDADVPPDTSLSVHLRAGASPVPDATWGPWSSDFSPPPANLDLRPLALRGGNVQVEFTFKTNARDTTARLKSFQFVWRCPST